MEDQKHTVEMIEFQGIPVNNYFHRIGDPNFRIDSTLGNYRLSIIDGKSSMNEEEQEVYRLGNFKYI